MPLCRELMAAGRHDLRYALQLHGHSKLASLLSLRPATRGAYPRTSSSEAV